MSVVVVSDGPTGGLVRAARRIDNLPGWPDGVRAARWVEGLAAQLASRGVSPVNDHVGRIESGDEGFTISAVKHRFRARTVVVAAGTRPVPFRPELAESPRFHRDAADLPDDMRGARVAVIGSGEAALDTALNLIERGAGVTIFARGPELNACPALLREFHASSAALVPGASLRSAVLDAHSVCLKFAGFPDWLGDHVVAAIGRESRIDEIDMTGVERGAGGNDGAGGTGGAGSAGTPGIWFAGDVLRDRERYVAMALGDGQRAACLAHAYITRRNDR
jgi:thioredoxin reductase (NADPH)